MAWTKLWVIAYRDLIRNRRRTFFTLLAVALGLALLIVLNGFIAGILDDALQNSIRLQTGHVQVRAETYEDSRRSLQWKDLVEQPGEIAAQAATMPEVAAATPILWADTILNTSSESVGMQLYGIEPDSAFYDPIRASLVGGNFIEANDRGGVMIGKRMADSLGLKLGENVSLTTINADGVPEEGIFAIRGIFDSGVLVYDEATVFMPIAKAQSFALTGDRASTIIMLLHDENDADQVAAAVTAPGLQALTWRELNAVFLETMGTAMSFYWILDGIVMLIVAVIIANTLLMAVFERIREMGILSALGMKRRQVMQMMIFEASIISLAGIILGLAIGLGFVALLTQNGFVMGEMAGSTPTIPLSAVVYAKFAPETFAWLAVWTFIIALLASLYPAWFAARLEPVKALHAS
ncbi:MAG: ABC transporter permease [Caldilineaceae bacterium]|nr:ABC transporter permease [Caldilinea sp.]MCB0058687.1 ABC transporter permease [Caldilineaceae bacterium]MCB9115525.1 ABC transporter permease [Caldilineaceae bacterium]HRW47692.1 ABC transporter permease [Caldilinea sp.]